MVLKTHKGRALTTTRDSHGMTLTDWKDATLNDARHGESLRVEGKTAILGMTACSGALKNTKRMYGASFKRAMNVRIRFQTNLPIKSTQSAPCTQSTSTPDLSLRTSIIAVLLERVLYDPIKRSRADPFFQIYMVH